MGNLKFTIRDLLWLTLVIALGIGWSIDRWRRPHTRYRLVETESELKIIDSKTGDIWLKSEGGRERWHKITELGARDRTP